MNDAPPMEQVLAHYRLVGPLIDASLANTPIVFVNYPGGVDKDAVYHVDTVPLSVDKLLWLVTRKRRSSFTPGRQDYSMLTGCDSAASYSRRRLAWASSASNSRRSRCARCSLMRSSKRSRFSTAAPA